MPFRVYRVIYAALLTLAALAPRGVIPCLDLILYPSSFGASFPCLFCSLSHIPYYTIKSLFWTLPMRWILSLMYPSRNFRRFIWSRKQRETRGTRGAGKSLPLRRTHNKFLARKRYKTFSTFLFIYCEYQQPHYMADYFLLKLYCLLQQAIGAKGSCCAAWAICASMACCKTARTSWSICTEDMKLRAAFLFTSGVGLEDPEKAVELCAYHIRKDIRDTFFYCFEEIPDKADLSKMVVGTNSRGLRPCGRIWNSRRAAMARGIRWWSSV